MKITFWGVRGSIATSGPEFSRTGGNTTCIEVEARGERLIIDAGTGVRGLGDKINQEANRLAKPVGAHFLFTHLHWDHIQGFPFFAPAYRPGAQVSLRGPKGEDGTVDLERVLARQMEGPTFPVPLAAMRAEKRFETVKSGDAFEIGPFLVRARALCHPQGSLGYRIEAGGRSFCFATDTEHVPGSDIDEAILDLGNGVDLLVHDAQYTEAEYLGREGPPRKGWGHSTYASAARIARAAGAKRLGLFHHDPAHGDAIVEAIERDAQSLFSPCFATREGCSVEL